MILFIFLFSGWVFPQIYMRSRTTLYGKSYLFLCHSPYVCRYWQGVSTKLTQSITNQNQLCGDSTVLYSLLAIYISINTILSVLNSFMYRIIFLVIAHFLTDLTKAYRSHWKQDTVYH